MTQLKNSIGLRVLAREGKLISGMLFTPLSLDNPHLVQGMGVAEEWNPGVLIAPNLPPCWTERVPR